jgi:multidrug efflux pump subunit AcrA (membrane-fusion protein)
VLVDVARPPPSWRPGGFVTARLVLGETKAELVLPRDAILYRENRPYAWIAEEHEAKLVARRAWLELGAGDPTRLIIVKGVNPGDQVVVEGMAGLSDGIPVSIRADDAAAAAEKPAAGKSQ